MTILQKIFIADIAEKKWLKIVLWWEIRRLLYNLFLIFFLLITIGILSILPNNGFVKLYPGPMLAVGVYFGILLFFVLSNLFYTTGWIFQLATRNMNWVKIKLLTQKSFILGILISLLVTITPVIFGVLNLIFTNE
jgi:hypothetical protein